MLGGLGLVVKGLGCGVGLGLGFGVFGVYDSGLVLRGLFLRLV